MTRRERELESEGALAAMRGEELEKSYYTKLRGASRRLAFRRGYERGRGRQQAELFTVEQHEDFDTNLERLKAFARTL
jgi:hypothetical protein